MATERFPPDPAPPDPRPERSRRRPRHSGGCHRAAYRPRCRPDHRFPLETVKTGWASTGFRIPVKAQGKVHQIALCNRVRSSPAPECTCVDHLHIGPLPRQPAFQLWHQTVVNGQTIALGQAVTQGCNRHGFSLRRHRENQRNCKDQLARTANRPISRKDAPEAEQPKNLCVHCHDRSCSFP